MHRIHCIHAIRYRTPPIRGAVFERFLTMSNASLSASIVACFKPSAKHAAQSAMRGAVEQALGNAFANGKDGKPTGDLSIIVDAIRDLTGGKPVKEYSALAPDHVLTWVESGIYRLSSVLIDAKKRIKAKEDGGQAIPAIVMALDAFLAADTEKRAEKSNATVSKAKQTRADKAVTAKVEADKAMREAIHAATAGTISKVELLANIAKGDADALALAGEIARALADYRASLDVKGKAKAKAKA